MTFNELATKHRLGLLRFLMWKTKGDKSLSEDLCQITLVRAHGAYAELNDKEAFPAWLKKIATNAFLNHVERNKALFSLTTATEKDLIDNDEVGPDIRIIMRERREELMDLVYALPDQQRKAMALRLFEGMSFKEIAEALNAPFDTAKANYRHGMLKIEAIMAKRRGGAAA